MPEIGPFGICGSSWVEDAVHYMQTVQNRYLDKSSAVVADLNYSHNIKYLLFGSDRSAMFITLKFAVKSAQLRQGHMASLEILET